MLLGFVSFRILLTFHMDIHDRAYRRRSSSTLVGKCRNHKFEWHNRSLVGLHLGGLPRIVPDQRCPHCLPVQESSEENKTKEYQDSSFRKSVTSSNLECLLYLILFHRLDLVM